LALFQKKWKKLEYFKGDCDQDHSRKI